MSKEVYRYLILNLQFYFLKNKIYSSCFPKRFIKPINKLENSISYRKQLKIKKYKGNK